MTRDCVSAFAYNFFTPRTDYLYLFPLHVSRSFKADLVPILYDLHDLCDLYDLYDLAHEACYDRGAPFGPYYF